MLEQGYPETDHFPEQGARVCDAGELGRRPRARANDDFHKQERPEAAVQSQIPVREPETSHPGSAQGQEHQQATNFTSRSENRSEERRERTKRGSR